MTIYMRKGHYHRIKVERDVSPHSKKGADRSRRPICWRSVTDPDVTIRGPAPAGTYPVPIPTTAPPATMSVVMVVPVPIPMAVVVMVTMSIVTMSVTMSVAVTMSVTMSMSVTAVALAGNRCGREHHGGGDCDDEADFSKHCSSKLIARSARTALCY